MNRIAQLLDRLESPRAAGILLGAVTAPGSGHEVFGDDALRLADLATRLESALESSSPPPAPKARDSMSRPLRWPHPSSGPDTRPGTVVLTAEQLVSTRGDGVASIVLANAHECRRRRLEDAAALTHDVSSR